VRDALAAFKGKSKSIARKRAPTNAGDRLLLPLNAARA
jgi:hypothetical protein